MRAFANHHMALVGRVDQLGEHFLRHVERRILVPLGDDQKRGNPNLSRSPHEPYEPARA